jgi:hypothetical protein
MSIECSLSSIQLGFDTTWMRKWGYEQKQKQKHAFTHQLCRGEFINSAIFNVADRKEHRGIRWSTKLFDKHTFDVKILQ